MTTPVFSVDDHVVIVTGASRGLGQAIARGFWGHQARLVVVARSNSLKDAFPEASPGRLVTIQCDIAEDGAATRIRDIAMETFGRIDVLVNNAGITMPNKRPYESEEIWDQTLRVNLKAPFLLSGAVSEVMKQQGGGSIIHIASVGGKLGFPGNPSYQASKAGLLNLTRAMAYDWGRYGIRVNSISPGYFRTAMGSQSYSDPLLRQMRADRTLLGRWGEPEELVGACLFLASSAASYVTGSDIVVDGGWTAKGL